MSTTHVIAWDSAEKKNNQDILPLSHLTHAVTWMVFFFDFSWELGGEKTLIQFRWDRCCFCLALNGLTKCVCVKRMLFGKLEQGVTKISKSFSRSMDHTLVDLA